MILSDIDIRAAQGETLIIEPFEEKHVTAVGYDVSVGNFVYLLGQGLLTPKNGVFRIPSGGTVQILTKETMWLSSELAATVHSRVLLVSKGLSHISTTIDPSWAGPLLITTTNLSKTEVVLPEKGTFATIVFHVLKTPTKTKKRTFSFVRELLTNQVLEARSREYVERVATIVGDKSISDEFSARLAEANRPLKTFVDKQIRAVSWKRVLDGLETALLWIGLFAIGSLHSYWDSIKPWLHDIPYDSKVFAAQVAGFIALLVYLRKRG
jgi:deoxycytidine triphosphate deaminase